MQATVLRDGLVFLGSLAVMIGSGGQAWESLASYKIERTHLRDQLGITAAQFSENLPATSLTGNLITDAAYYFLATMATVFAVFRSAGSYLSAGGRGRGIRASYSARAARGIFGEEPEGYRAQHGFPDETLSLDTTKARARAFYLSAIWWSLILMGATATSVATAMDLFWPNQ